MKTASMLMVTLALLAQSATAAQEPDVSAPVPALVSLRGSSSSEPKMVALASDTCTLYDVGDGICDEVVLYCPFGKRFLTEGTCKSQGYTVFKDTTPFPFYYNTTVTEYTKPKMVALAADTSNLYVVTKGVCEELLLDYPLSTNPIGVKLAEGLGWKEGTCKSQGYTVVKTPTSTKSYPFIGEVTVTEYTKPKMVALASDTCTLYDVTKGVCEELTIDYSCNGYAVQQGTCKSQGYTVVKIATTTKDYPFVGPVTVTLYTKPKVAALAV